jgi:Asp-tRNA(Asn)/Glu-tRNA(Gln) amidotransferase A subunit family amidase
MKTNHPSFRSNGGGAARDMSARDAARAIAAGLLTCETLVGQLLDHIQENELVVKAWAHLDREQALRTARELDGSGGSGWLYGVPIGWKDIIDCAGQPTACGSPIYAGNVAGKDAGAVAMTRRAGALALGKTVTAEFAATSPGATTNPHNPAHTPGGSSSGSAAAVAAGMVPLAIGTQTGGSVIRPASFCGVVGFKPSFGMITREGVKPLSESLDTVGTFARNVDDTGLLMAALTGRTEFAALAPSRPRRVVLCRDMNWDEAEASTVTALSNTLKRLSEHGVEVGERRMPEWFDALFAAHHAIEYFEMARALQDEYRRHREQLSEPLSARIEQGLTLDPAEYEEALLRRRQAQDALADIFDDVDLLLVPSAPGEAPEGLKSTGKSVFNRVWTALGVPCITLPGHRGPKNLPVGVQFIAPARQDARLLAHAAWVEQLLSC